MNDSLLKPQLLRIIPCLLLHKGGLVKTTRFKSPVYVGDPINAVKIFSDKGADELLIIDIDATVDEREPHFESLRGICSQAFMPLCYGGGVKTIAQMEQLYALGFEKVSLSSAALERPELVREASKKFGAQSVVVTLDIKRSTFTKRFIVVSHRGKRKWTLDYIDAVQQFVKLGVGEIVINDVDRDGTMEGYDQALFRKAAQASPVPVVALGGAKDLADIEAVLTDGGASGAAAGSLFVFKGPHRAVLINYPERNF